LCRALEQLYALGALDEDGNLTKPLGESLARLPVEPTMGKVLIVAAQSGCASAALAVVAMDSTDTVFSTSRYPEAAQITFPRKVLLAIDTLYSDRHKSSSCCDAIKCTEVPF
jgi:HrpA-like RNA helicase